MINKNNKYKSSKEQASRLKSKQAVKNKRRFLCALGGILLASSLMTGCGKTTEQEVTHLKETSTESVFVIGMDTSDFTLEGLGDELTDVTIEATNLTDVSALAQYDNLTSVDVSDNLITDVSALEDLENLQYLDISNNSVSEINLENFENLNRISLEQNYNLYTNDILDYCQEHNIQIDIDKQDVEYVDQIRADLDKLDLENKTEYERIRALEKYCTQHMEYDDAALKDNALASEYNVNDLQHAVEGQGVCATYATLADVVFELEGVHSYQLAGLGDAGLFNKDGHQWNLIEVDGEYMLCDLTWADTYKTDLFQNKYLNLTGDKAESFIDKHGEMHDQVNDVKHADPTNVRSNMAVHSDVNHIKHPDTVQTAEAEVEDIKEDNKLDDAQPASVVEDSTEVVTQTVDDKEVKQDRSIENVISDIKGVFEGIDFSKVPVKEILGVLAAGIAAGSIRKLAKNTNKRIKAKLAKRKADKKLVEVSNKDIKEYEELVAKLQQPVQEEVIEMPAKKEKEVQPRELTIEEQLEMLDSNEDKIAFLESMSDQTLRDAATKQVDLDMANGNTEKTFKEEKIQQAMQELLQIRGLTPEQKAVVRNINDGIFKDDFDLSQATSYEKESIAATIRFYTEVDSEMDKYEWLQTIQQQLTQDTTKSL